MSTLAQQYLTSFARRADQRLAALTRELAGALASGDEARATHLRYEGQLLSHGLASTTPMANDYPGQLSDDERVFIAGKLLPLERDALTSTTPDPTPVSLTLNPLIGRTRGQADAAPLLISGQVSGPLAAGTVLLVTRDGVALQRVTLSGPGAYSVSDAAPGTRYRVELLGTGLSREALRELVSPVLCGTAQHGLGASALAALPWVPAAFAGTATTARFSIVGERTRIYLCVPGTRGRVGTLTQPDDQDADITSAFTHAAVTLDFGADGQAEYDVLENYANLIGAFTFDAHL